ncbi:MAG: hypothetical protein KDC44_10815, partial [Phaeodactylibacter sp.]|nr:hypothetical protein [Phaeodactylibacter sp.]
EEFPLTRTYLEPGRAPNTFDFQCEVNHEFKGLLNFIMSNAQHLEVVNPPELSALVRQEAEAILKKF